MVLLSHVFCSLVVALRSRGGGGNWWVFLVCFLPLFFFLLLSKHYPQGKKKKNEPFILKLISPDLAVNAYTLFKITKQAKGLKTKNKQASKPTKNPYVTSTICLVLLKMQVSLKCTCNCWILRNIWGGTFKFGMIQFTWRDELYFL